MKKHVYTAAVYTTGVTAIHRTLEHTEGEQAVLDHCFHDVLESYAYISGDRYVDEIRRSGQKIFLDSGAFSAATIGKTLSIDEYIAFIKRNKDIIDKRHGQLMVAALDVIGDAKNTHKNVLYMERKGVPAIPCFHSGESTRYLEDYCKNFDFIALGGVAGADKKLMLSWFDYVWLLIKKVRKGRPLRVHGFGITSPAVIERYPWYSVDSSTWIWQSKTGCILLPPPIWRSVGIAEDSPLCKVPGKSYHNMSPLNRRTIEDTVKRYRFSVDKLSRHYQSRWLFNIMSFQLLARHINKRTKSSTLLQQDLFGGA